MNIIVTHSFHSHQASARVKVITAIFHAVRLAYWSSFCAASSKRSSCAGSLRSFIGPVVDCEGVGTFCAIRSHPSLYQTRIHCAIPSNMHPPSQTSHHHFQFTLRTWGFRSCQSRVRKRVCASAHDCRLWSWHTERVYEQWIVKSSEFHRLRADTRRIHEQINDKNPHCH